MFNLGLRPRIAILLLLPLALLGGLTQLLLQWDMQRNVAALEQTEAAGDLRRVLQSFEGQTQNLSGVLRSWANWTALYQHAVRPDPGFRAEELTIDALAVGNIDWLVLIDPDGRITEQVEVPRVDGSAPASAELRAEAATFQAHFAAVERKPACGLVNAMRQLAVVCYSPVRRSDGTGGYSGLVLLGRWVDAGLLGQVTQQTGRTFRLDVTEPRPGAPTVARGGAMFGLERLQTTREPERLLLRVPIYSLLGRHVGELEMDWPRRNSAEAAARLASSQRMMILLVVASGGLLVLLLDQLVVKRLTRLRQELAVVMEEGNWHGTVTQRGRDEIGELAGFFNQLLGVVRRQMGELRNLSATDALTGLPNRRAFDERLNYLLVRNARQARAAALLIIDVDRFKRYNDSLGHPAGDEALKAIAQALKASVRRQLDLPARIGGEEFGVLLEDAGEDGALACAQAVCQAVRDLALVHPDNPPWPHMTVSCGVATLRPEETAEALYRRADGALYTAKQAGRNRITVAD